LVTKIRDLKFDRFTNRESASKQSERQPYGFPLWISPEAARTAKAAPSIDPLGSFKTVPLPSKIHKSLSFEKRPQMDLFEQ
jgi:hypothetical protein